MHLRNLDPVFDKLATELGIKNINTEITNTLPQRVLAGVYHEFESGNYFTLDGLWMKFSDFSVSNIKLNGNDVNISTPDIYDDIWAFTAGADVSYELSDDRKVDINATLLDVGESPVDTESVTDRVAGKNEDHYAFMTELTFHF